MAKLTIMAPPAGQKLTNPYLRIVESIQQDTPDASVPLTPGPVRIVPADGTIDRAKSDVAGNAACYGVIVKRVPGGCASTVIRRGVIFGYDLSNVPFGALVYLDNDGDLSTAKGTIEVIVGRVIALKAAPYGQPNDKALAVEC